MTAQFTLINGHNEATQSDQPGTFGGHKGLRIYGRLNCANALRWIAKGHYVQQRVFFANEDTAKAAGYRPCGCCMKAEHKAWHSTTRKRITTC